MVEGVCSLPCQFRMTSHVYCQRPGYRLSPATTLSPGDHDTMLLIQSGPEAQSSWVQSHQSHLRATERQGQHVKQTKRGTYYSHCPSLLLSRPHITTLTSLHRVYFRW